MITTPIVAVIDYSFGNYKLQPLTDLSAPSAGFTPEETSLEASANELTVATFNVENLDPGDSSSKFSGLADSIVAGLGSPDIIAGDVLTNLWSTVPISDQYSFVFDGNSQVLDHILVSESIDDIAPPEFDVVHVNVDRYYIAVSGLCPAVASNCRRSHLHR